MQEMNSNGRSGVILKGWLLLLQLAFSTNFPQPLDTSSIRRKIPPNVQASRPQKIVAPTLLRDDCLYFSEN